MYDRVNKINKVYNDDGFQGVLEYVENHLQYGEVEMFRMHYVRYIRGGGAFYFAENKDAEVEMQITK